MNNQNDCDPYAPPKAETITNRYAELKAGYRVEKKLIALQDGAKLPRICFLTGEDIPTAFRTRQVLYWISPLWGLIVLVFVPFFILYFENYIL